MYVFTTRQVQCYGRAEFCHGRAGQVSPGEAAQRTDTRSPHRAPGVQHRPGGHEVLRRRRRRPGDGVLPAHPRLVHSTLFLPFVVYMPRFVSLFSRSLYDADEDAFRWVPTNSWRSQANRPSTPSTVNVSASPNTWRSWRRSAS